MRRVVTLESSKLFRHLPAGELLKLRAVSRESSFAAGQSIFKEGDPADGMYIVKTGQVQISALLETGERQILSQVSPGDVFGEMAVLDNQPRSASASAERDSIVYFVPRDELVTLFQDFPDLAMNMVQEISGRLREFNRQYIRKVLQVERITNLVNDILEFTRGTPAALPVIPMDYAAFVKSVVEEFQPEVALKSITIEFENQPPSVKLPLNPKRLSRVFYNLVHNAVDAMPGGGRIKLRFAATETEVITELEDTGPGIAPEIAEHLFEAFATFGKSKGTGLGLSISQRIIAEHLGKISARTEAGRGAIFSFSLPKQRP